jgi:hypothetical protein
MKRIRHLRAQFRKRTKSSRKQPVRARLPGVVVPAENARLDGVAASRKVRNVAVDVVATGIVTEM